MKKSLRMRSFRKDSHPAPGELDLIGLGYVRRSVVFKTLPQVIRTIARAEIVPTPTDSGTVVAEARQPVF